MSAPEDSDTVAANGDRSSAALLEANQMLVVATMRAQAAEDTLRESVRHKDEFLAMLGHELRNPLAPIRNAAEVLLCHAGGNERMTWVHDVLVRQVEHITRLVDDLLDISLISRDAMKLHFEPVDVGSAIGIAVEATRPLLERKHHRFRVALPPVATWIHGDAIRLTQVFENLLTNAAKYTSDGGEIAIDLEVLDTAAVVRVTDNGVGIAPGMQSRIFELFVQDARSADRSEGGLGIGLALVRHLVGLHGGVVEASSEGPGKGTEFVLRFPLLREGQARTPSRTAPPVGGTGRVMVVDDDVDSGETMAVLLEMYGYEVRRATSLETALEVGRAFRPQAVLMDISMPDADGYEVARRLGAIPEIGRGVAYIAVTGFAQPAHFERSREAGFARHLVKPVNPHELDQVLRDCLAAA